MRAMCFAVAICVLLLFPVALAQAPKPLTDDDVMQMVKAGLSETVILKFVVAGPGAFDTSLPAIMALKEAGLSDTVITAIMESDSRARAAAPAPPSAPPLAVPAPASAPVEPGKSSGVYYKDPASGAWTKIEEAKAGQSNARKSLLGEMTGVHTVAYVEIFRGAEADLRIKEARPVFWVRVSENALLSGISGRIKDAVILRLDRKKDRREILAGTATPETRKGAKTGVVTAVAIGQLGEDLVTVTPKNDLEAGEYLLAFGEPNCGFDFGIAK